MSHTLHIYLDGCENHHIDRAIKHLVITKPHYVNLTAAARYDQAPDVIRRIRAAVTGIRVIWRGWKSENWRDEGMWLKKTPQQWYDYRVVPHRDFLKEHRVILMADNESGMDDVKGYAQWQADVMALLAKDALELAALRTSTGTPNEDRYVDFEVAYRAMAKYGGVLSPNEYASTVASETSGNVERYKHHLAQFDRLKLPYPPVVIGEFAILKHIWLPYDGYSSFGIGGKEYARRIIDLLEAWYRPRNAWVCVYSFGKWGTLGIQDDEDYLAEIEQHYLAHPNPPIPKETPHQPPAEPPAPPTIPAEWRNALADMILNVQMLRARLTGQRRTVAAETSAIETLLENRTDWLAQIDKELADLEQFANRLSKLS